MPINMTQIKSNQGIRELARKLNLSIGTVSRSLNNRYGVNAQTKARVLEEARRMGYVPNAAARRLKEHPVLNVGLFFAPYDNPGHEINPYATDLIQLITDKASDENFRFEVIRFVDLPTVTTQLQEQQLDVALTLGDFPEPFYSMLSEKNLPVINISKETDLPNQICIQTDGFQAYALAVQYLAALGHTQIALVNGPQKGGHFLQYAAAFDDAISEFHLTCLPGWKIELPPEKTNAQGARIATLELLKQDTRPTAIVYGSDWLAMGGIKAIRESQLRVGEDISVVGHDNLPMTELLDPPLTTFDMHLEGQARSIIRLITRLSDGQPLIDPDRPASVINITPNLVKRSSCRCIR
ncbi:MAG TPA: LacI family transcriptional regulator [Phycisphaerales bacterium]|nr:LacI family transcriptional regulator [Phycisphaerales bacterium]HCD32696.1 LacI family transcriptional regulator [Phycisphaerales bacterium]|tara:strand:+ start:65672 stop:66730 length:1059 start_codon:yes stop_codon:yes gene_type:complete